MPRDKRGEVQRTVRIPAEEYESLKETVEVLRDRELVESMVRGLEDIQKGRTVPHSQIRKGLRGR